MHFALVGDHRDGLEMARALAATGRHELTSCAGLTAACREKLPASAKAIGDLEEMLADPAIDLVIVAGKPGDRAAQLRRALQSERHVLCVYPPADNPDVAYEASLLQGDTKKVLLPLLPLHPAMLRLRDWLRTRPGFRLLRLEHWSAQREASFAEWHALRALGGEIVEVSAFAAAEEMPVHEPLLLAGRFEGGGLFQATLLHEPGETHWRLSVVGDGASAEVDLAKNGSCRVELREPSGENREERWEAYDPWPALVDVFETALQCPGEAKGWQDAIRCLELDDAARRSVERRRASLLEFPEASEEVGFKGTMTLVGCGVLWGSLLLLILSNWFPSAGLLIAPVLVGFLVLQMLRWIIPRR